MKVGVEAQGQGKCVPPHCSGTGDHRMPFLGLDEEVPDHMGLSFQPVILEFHVCWVSRHLEVDPALKGVIAPEGNLGEVLGLLW